MEFFNLQRGQRSFFSNSASALHTTAKKRIQISSFSNDMQEELKKIFKNMEAPKDSYPEKSNPFVTQTSHVSEDIESSHQIAKNILNPPKKTYNTHFQSTNVSSIQNLPENLPADAASESASEAAASEVASENSEKAAAASSAYNSVQMGKLLPFILPLIGWSIYSSKKKILNNIHMELHAKIEPKTYQIALGKGNTELRIGDFEFTAGKPLRFLNRIQQGNECSYEDNLPPSLYESKDLNPLQLWKRKERFTTIVIDILDASFNPSLENGPKIYSFPLSKKETVCILHRNPFTNAYSNQNEMSIIEEKSSEWATINHHSLEIKDQTYLEKESLQKFSLPSFDERHPEKLSDEYVLVVQKPESTLFTHIM